MQKIQNRMANLVDPDEMACDKPSHLVLHCLQRFWSAEAKVFKVYQIPITSSCKIVTGSLSKVSRTSTIRTQVRGCRVVIPEH